MENDPKKNVEILKSIVEHAKLLVKENDAKCPAFIAIAGCSAVGKSYFAQELGELLNKEGVKTATLRLDDFLNPDYFDAEHFHPRLEYYLAHAVIQKIKNGEKLIRKPAWEKRKAPQRKIEEDFVVEGVSIILFEGEFTLCADAPYDFSKYSKFGIFIDAQDQDIIEWNWKRNRNISEKTMEEFAAKTKPCLESYRTYVQSSKDSALYRVLKDKSHHYTLQKCNEKQ